MARASRSTIVCLLALALTASACGAAASPSNGSTAEPSGSAASTASPARTVQPTPSPTVAPSPSSTPGVTPPPTPAETVRRIATPVWTFEKPLVLKGGTGRTIWSDVMFATKTATLRWTGTPAGRTGCTLTVMLESKRLPKTIRMTSKSTTTKPLAGSTSIAINYGDGTMTVTSDCARWTVTVRPTGHPGVAVKRATEQTATNATTPAGLNVALGRSHVDWWISTSYTYAGTVSPRLLSKEVTLDVTFELPKWTAPKGADARLVEAWSSALAGMKRHTEGEAVIAVQAAGRYLAALTKTRFPSMSALHRYLDDRFETYAGWSNERMSAYDIATGWGGLQGGVVE